MKCLLTGVSRGIGHALATALLKEGHSVWGLSRTPPADLCVDTTGRFHHSICDVGSEPDRKRAGEYMAEAGFVPDVVVLNAAIEYEEADESLSWDKMQQVLRINVEGALYWVSHWMDQQPCPPIQFIGMSSLLAFWPDADCPAYGASKAALSMAFRAWRIRYSGKEVAFKLLYLGPVHTSINPRFVHRDEPGRGVVTPEAVAGYMVNTVLPNRRFAFYYPWTAGLVCRFGTWMPDLIFERLTRPLQR